MFLYENDKKRRGVKLCTNVYSVVIAFILCEYIFLDVRFVWLSGNICEIVIYLRKQKIYNDGCM